MRSSVIRVDLKPGTSEKTFQKQGLDAAGETWAHGWAYSDIACAAQRHSNRLGQSSARMPVLRKLVILPDSQRPGRKNGQNARQPVRDLTDRSRMRPGKCRCNGRLVPNHGKGKQLWV
jgi:hypothetical protein